MFCPNCGTKNEPQYRFCSGCGTDLHEAAASETPPAAEPAAPPPVAPASPTGNMGPATGVAGSAPSSGSPPWGSTPPEPAAPTPGPWASPPPAPSAPGAPVSSSAPSAGGIPGWGEPAPPSDDGGRAVIDTRPPPIGLIVGAVAVILVGFLLLRPKHKVEPPPPPPPTHTATATATPEATPTATDTTAAGTTTAGNATPTADSSGLTSGPCPLPTVPGATTDVLLQDLVTCRNVQGNGAPIDPTTVFHQHDRLYCSVKAWHLKPGSVVNVVWQGPQNACKIQPLISKAAEGNYYLKFYWDPAKDSWPIGTYTVTMIADGVAQRSVQFQVVGGG